MLGGERRGVVSARTAGAVRGRRGAPKAFSWSWLMTDGCQCAIFQRKFQTRTARNSTATRP
eukprot:6035333-Prymnesium_polylepis.1